MNEPVNPPAARGVSIVMPAYDELSNLRELLPAIHDALDASQAAPREVLVVLPHSAPSSEIQEIEGLGATVVKRGPTNSFGDAIRSGLAAVSPLSEFVIIMDADGSHDPHTIGRLLAVPAEVDVAVASRYTDGGTTDNSLSLRLMSRSLNLAFRVVLGLRCNDVSTNFKRYRAKDVRGIALTGRDFDVVEELLFRVKYRHGHSFQIVEIPDHFHERNHGTTKRELGPFIASYVTALAKLRWQSSRQSE